MSFAISQNEAFPTGQKFGKPALTARKFYSANTSALPNVGTSPKGLESDQVRFGQDRPLEATQASKQAEKIHDANDYINSGEKEQPASGAKQTYGHKENNIREAARIVLCDIAPLALSVLPLVGIPGLGFVFALATLPMSYLSGKLGRRVAKDVNPDDLNPAFQYIHQVRHALTSKHKDGNVVDNINKATDDLLNVRNMPAIVTSTLLPRLKVKEGGWAANALNKINSVALMRAEVNIRLAQAENKKDAGKAMFNGVKDFALYSAMNKMGTAMVGSSLPGAKWAGEFLKNAAWMKIAYDLLHARENKTGAKQEVKPAAAS